MPSLSGARLDYVKHIVNALPTADEQMVAPAGVTAVDDARVVRIQHTIAALILAAFVAVGWIVRPPTNIVGSDELEYRALSQSIDQGTYREIYQASAPLAVKYPPVFPLWLAASRRVVGDHLDFVRGANLIFAACALALLYRASRRVTGGWMAVAALGVIAINPAVLHYAGTMLAESLYLLVSTAALAAVIALPPRVEWQRVVLALGLGVIALFTRSIGIVVLASVGAVIATRVSRRALFMSALVPILGAGAWFTYTTKARSGPLSKSYVRDLADAGISIQAIPATAKRASRTAVTLGTRTLPWTMAVPTLEGTPADNVFWVVTLALLLGAGLVALWKRWRAAAYYVILYGGILLVWPYPNDRLVSMLVPLTIVGMFAGLALLVERWSRRPMMIAAGALAALLIAGAAPRTIARASEAGSCDRANPGADDGCHDPQTRAIVDGARYLGGHSLEGDFAVASKVASVHFISGRRTVQMRTLMQIPIRQLADTLRERKVRFVLLTTAFEGEDGSFANGLKTVCEQFHVEYESPPHVLLLSLPSASDSVTACAALERFVASFPRPDPLADRRWPVRGPGD